MYNLVTNIKMIIYMSLSSITIQGRYTNTGEAAMCNLARWLEEESRVKPGTREGRTGIIDTGRNTGWNMGWSKEHCTTSPQQSNRVDRDAMDVGVDCACFVLM